MKVPNSDRKEQKSHYSSQKPALDPSRCALSRQHCSNFEFTLPRSIIDASTPPFILQTSSVTNTFHIVLSVYSRSAIQKRSSLRSQIAMVLDPQQMLESLVECEGQTKDKKISVEELRKALKNCMEAFDLLPSASRCSIPNVLALQCTNSTTN